MAEPLLEVDALTKHYPIQKGVLQRTVGHVQAVDRVSFDVAAGETLGVVGESGCGKSTVARCVLRLVAPTTGAIRLGGEDITNLDRRAVRPYRRRLQAIFQDPYSSLNPRMTVQQIVGEPLKVHGVVPQSGLKARIGELLEQVDLKREYMSRYPHAFSGGQRQRIAIARALATEPRFLVCDEAVSALDVSVQAQVLNLLKRLQRELNLTYLFISHDLSVIRHLCDRVAVMYVGRLVEVAGTEELFYKPRHPYTEALLSAVPKTDPKLKSKRIVLQGEVANPAAPPSGCFFHPRCPYAQDICKSEYPPLRTVGDSGRLAACHFADELDLAGIERIRDLAGSV